MTPDPTLTAEQSAALRREIARCDRVLAKLWAEPARGDVLRRRRALLRILFDVPQGVMLPLDWQPPEHPQTARLGQLR